MIKRTAFLKPLGIEDIQENNKWSNMLCKFEIKILNK